MCSPANDVLARVGEEFHGSPVEFMWAAFSALPVWFAALGAFTAWWFFLKKPELADAAERRFKWLHTILVNKYGFDWFNENVIVPAAQLPGRRPVALRRSDRDRRRAGQRQRPHRRLAGIGDALRAVGVPVPLRVRDDPGAGLLPGVAAMANMMFGGHLLSLLIWLPIVGGFAVLTLNERVAAAKWLSLIVSGLSLRLSVPLFALVQDRHGRDAIHRARALDFDHSFGVLHRGGRHLDAADPADHFHDRAHRHRELDATWKSAWRSILPRS